MSDEKLKKQIKEKAHQKSLAKKHYKKQMTTGDYALSEAKKKKEEAAGLINTETKPKTKKVLRFMK